MIPRGPPPPLCPALLPAPAWHTSGLRLEQSVLQPASLSSAAAGPDISLPAFVPSVPRSRAQVRGAWEGLGAGAGQRGQLWGELPPAAMRALFPELDSFSGEEEAGNRKFQKERERVQRACLSRQRGHTTRQAGEGPRSPPGGQALVTGGLARPGPARGAGRRARRGVFRTSLEWVVFFLREGGTEWPGRQLWGLGGDRPPARVTCTLESYTSITVGALRRSPSPKASSEVSQNPNRATPSSPVPSAPLLPHPPRPSAPRPCSSLPASPNLATLGSCSNAHSQGGCSEILISWGPGLCTYRRNPRANWHPEKHPMAQEALFSPGPFPHTCTNATPLPPGPPHPLALLCFCRVCSPPSP